jgi:cytochrome c5
MRAQNYIYIGTALIVAWSSMSFAYAEEKPVSTEPIQLENTIQKQIETGNKLFKSICVHCHNTTYEESRIGAPGLKGVLERHNEAWLNHWIKSPETLAQTDVAARDLIDSNRFGLACPTLPTVQDGHNRADIIEFLKTLQ